MPKFHLQPPPPMLMPVDQPRIILPKPLPPEPPKIEMKAETLTPKVLAPQQKVVLAPQPRLAMATNQQATVIKQSLLGKSAAFGDPFGARPIANAQRSATMTAFGGVGSGQQSNMVRSGVVQGTGFGTGSGAARGTSSNGVVASTAFSNSSANRPSAQQPTQQAVASINPVILSEPKAQYTEQAKSAHAHGEVIVAVLFRADGSVTVQHVVRGLGYGLDEEAMKVAAGIRFKPATRGGQPVDFETNIHVVFQLA
jgi:TonB family protein